MIRGTYDTNPDGRGGDFVRGAIATLYAAGMISTGGLRLLLFSAILYTIGSILFVLARREQGKTVFTGMEDFLLGVVLVAAVIGNLWSRFGIIVDLAKISFRRYWQLRWIPNNIGTPDPWVELESSWDIGLIPWLDGGTRPYSLIYRRG